jgi:hypothetical protein
MKKLKIGIIVDGMTVPKYYLDFINQICEEKSFFVEPVIINQKINSPNNHNTQPFTKLVQKIYKNGLASVIRSLLSRIIFFLETKALLKQEIYESFDVKTSIDNELRVLEICPEISPSGFVYRYNQESIRLILDLDLDLMLRFGSGILRGDILNICKFGVISLHHGDNREFRGTPAGFWEVFYSAPSSGFIIQQLTEELDAGKVLYRGNIMTASYWLKNSANIQIKSMFFLNKLLKNISLNESLPPGESSAIISSKLFRYPSLGILIKYFIQVHVPAFLTSLRGFFFKLKKRRWHVAFIKTDNLELDFTKVHSIPNPQDGFLADPFVIEYADQSYCFVEEFSYKQNKGKISTYLLSEDSAQPLGTALEETFHLSFPYLIEHNQDLFMIPESASNNDIRLYKNISFPNEWVLEKILIKNVDAADTVVFYQDNMWFMLTNICSSNVSDHQSELHLFSSKELVSDNWSPAPSNPITFDSLKARNGGCFAYNGKQYRVNQVHDKSHYGKALQINEISKITPSSMVEKNILSMEPNFFKNINSTHHYDKSKYFVVFDYARDELI